MRLFALAIPAAVLSVCPRADAAQHCPPKYLEAAATTSLAGLGEVTPKLCIHVWNTTAAITLKFVAMAEVQDARRIKDEFETKLAQITNCPSVELRNITISAVRRPDVADLTVNIRFNKCTGLARETFRRASGGQFTVKGAVAYQLRQDRLYLTVDRDSLRVTPDVFDIVKYNVYTSVQGLLDRYHPSPYQSFAASKLDSFVRAASPTLDTVDVRLTERNLFQISAAVSAKLTSGSASSLLKDAVSGANYQDFTDFLTRAF
jgi:hypothetical protein